MDAGFLYFALGALASIPIAVLAPFGTSMLQRWGARRNESRAKARGVQLTQDFMWVRAAAHDRSLLTSYLLNKLLLITLISFGGGILTSLMQAIASALYSTTSATDPTSYYTATFWGSWANAGASLASILTFAIALPIGLRAIQVRNRVNNLEKYERNVNAELTGIGERPVRTVRS